MRGFGEGGAWGVFTGWRGGKRRRPARRAEQYQCCGRSHRARPRTALPAFTIATPSRHDIYSSRIIFIITIFIIDIIQQITYRSLARRLSISGANKCFLPWYRREMALSLQSSQNSRGLCLSVLCVYRLRFADCKSACVKSFKVSRPAMRGRQAAIGRAAPISHTCLFAFELLQIQWTVDGRRSDALRLRICYESIAYRSNPLRNVRTVKNCVYFAFTAH